MISKVHKNEQTNKPTNKSSGYSGRNGQGPGQQPSRGVQAKKRLSCLVYISEVQHGIIMNSTVLCYVHIILHAQIAQVNFGAMDWGGSVTGKENLQIRFSFSFPSLFIHNAIKHTGDVDIEEQCYCITLMRNWKV